MPNYFKKYLFILIPVVAAVITGIYFLSFGLKGYNTAVKIIFHGATMTAGIWLGCIAIVSFLWKKYPWEHYPFRHLAIEIAAITVYTLVFSSIIYFIEKSFFHIKEVDNLAMEIFITLIITYFISSVHESIFFYLQWKENFSKSVRLEKDNLEARYEALKAQINPHFLFNSLNGLANLAEGNETLVGYVEDLSELLRSVISSSESKLSLLSSELGIFNRYIRLQKMRYPSSLKVKSYIEDKYHSMAIPSLSLLMLAENCIKHNIISEDKPLLIEVFVEDEFLVVLNKLQKKPVENSTKIGLMNLSDRYRLFTSRRMETIENNENFIVRIPLLEVEL